MIRVPLFLALALGCALISGCVPRAESPAGVGKEPEDKVVQDSSPDKVAEKVGSEPAPGADKAIPGPAEKLKEAAKGSTRPIRIAPNRSEGWTPAAKPLVDLGKQMDAAMSDMGVRMANATTNIQYADGSAMMGKSTLRFDRGGKVRIEYYMPETRQRLHVLVSDGKRTMERSDSGWEPVAKSGASGPELTDAQAKAWTDTFMRDMFGQFRGNGDTWGPLFEAWAEGKGGFKASVESTTRRLMEKDRSYTRVVAKSTEGPPTEVEVIVDATKFLPITVRVIRQDSGGKEMKAQWSANWLTGGEHPEGAFKLPGT